MSNLKLGQQVTGSYRQASDSDYLAADDFNVNGDLVSLTIINATYEEVTSPNNRKKKMLCLHFKGTNKKLALNQTNAKSIVKTTGSNQVESWNGKVISLFRTTIKAFGDPKMPCIRIHEPTQNQ